MFCRHQNGSDQRSNEGPTRRQRSLTPSSPAVNILRTARKEAILTLSPAEDQSSSST
jgi:hypothetical protein